MPTFNPFDLEIPALAPNETVDWSPYQREIFTFIESQTGNAIVEAVAGSGKSTTILEASTRAKLANPDASIIMLAFNKSIAQELQQRCAPGVDARTFHSLGLSCFRGKKPKVDGWKVSNMLKTIIPADYIEDCLRDVARLVSLAKNNAMFDPRAEDFLPLLSDYTLNVPEGMDDEFASWAAGALAMSNREMQVIDFDDMLYLPLLYNATFPKFDFVFVDEAQDLNEVQHLVVERILSPSGGRLIAVGDTAQAIYGFRGADANSMNRFREKFATTELPLSLTYRCPKLITDVAASYVPAIHCPPDAPDGEVSQIDVFEEDTLSALTSNDLVVCRNNAPLFKLGMRLLRLRVPVTVLGNFDKQLISFINGFKTDDIRVFVDRLDKWYEAEYNRCLDSGLYSRAGIVDDKYASVSAIAQESDSVTAIKSTLAKLFTPGYGVTLSSIHRAKGTQAHNIYFYLPDLCPSKFAKTRAQLEQENNLIYVAVTRAQRTLTYVYHEVS